MILAISLFPAEMGNGSLTIGGNTLFPVRRIGKKVERQQQPRVFLQIIPKNKFSNTEYLYSKNIYICIHISPLRRAFHSFSFNTLFLNLFSIRLGYKERLKKKKRKKWRKMNINKVII